MRRGRLPRVIRVGRAVYTRYPQCQHEPFTELEKELMAKALDLLLSSGLVDGEPRELVEDLRSEFREFA